MRKPGDPIVSTESPPDETFYGRWSRRKHRDRAGLLEAEPAREDGRAAPPPAASVQPGQPERVLTDADMPDLDALGEDDDYSGFLSPGVSDALRRKALRKLFLSGKFNVRDGLDDYDDDFTSFAPLGDIVTSDMRHQMELAAERERARLREEQRIGELEDAPEPAGEPRPDEVARVAGEGDAGGEQEPASDAGLEVEAPEQRETARATGGAADGA